MMKTHTHTHTHANFFDYTKDDMKALKIDYIISNPPFSLKVQVIQKLKELNIPFAMLLPINAALETKERQFLYKQNGIQLLIPNTRMEFLNSEKKKVGSAVFITGYVCWNILEKQIIFDTWNKKDI